MSSFVTPTVEGSYRIMPSDIDATKPFLSAFGKAEVEGAALGLVLYCQDKGSWVPFTEAELTAHFRAAKAAGRIYPYRGLFSREQLWDFFGKKGEPLPPDPGAYPRFMSSPRGSAFAGDRPDEFEFYWLSPEEGLLVRKGDDGKYRVTELFIERCHRSSPARR